MHHLTKDEHAYWLDQHIRSRVHAVLAQPQLIREALDRLPPDEAEERAHHAFLLQASWEGRHAAMRWLIEFVGIAADSSGNIKSPSRKKDDLGIGDLGGQEVNRSLPEATALAQLWLDCTKATSHATHNSGHEPITEERLATAARFLIRHLQTELYAPAGKTL